MYQAYVETVSPKKYNMVPYRINRRLGDNLEPTPLTFIMEDTSLLQTIPDTGKKQKKSYYISSNGIVHFCKMLVMMIKATITTTK